MRYRGDTGEAARISEDWTISPRLLNHAQVFYNRRGNPQIGAEVGTDGAKALGIKNLSSQGYPVVNWNSGPIYNLTEGPGFIYDSFRADVMFGFNDTLSFNKGRHFIKMGFNAARNHQNTSPGTSPSFTFNALETAIPNETYSGTQTGYVFASYLLGIVHSAGQTEAVNLGGRRNYYAAFIQDDFKVSSRLTLNLRLALGLSAAGVRSGEPLLELGSEHHRSGHRLEGCVRFRRQLQRLHRSELLRDERLQGFRTAHRLRVAAASTSGPCAAPTASCTIPIPSTATTELRSASPPTRRGAAPIR